MQIVSSSRKKISSIAIGGMSQSEVMLTLILVSLPILLEG